MQPSRRTFLQLGAAALVSTTGCRTTAKPRRRNTASSFTANERLNVALIGTAGQGAHALRSLRASGQNIVALCDVDERALRAAVSANGGHNLQTHLHRDFRRLFDTTPNLDLVVIATPDHGHAPQATYALAHGCHLYIEPPLTRTLAETTTLLRQAQQKRLTITLGNQTTSEPNFIQALALIKAGIIGTVAEALVWTNRPLWPQGTPLPAGNDPVPDYLDWELWLCGAPMRLYKHHAYHRYNWRGWCDFGCGTLGDVGAQLLSLPCYALDLPAPHTITNRLPTATRALESYPRSSHLHFTFRRTPKSAPHLHLQWYDGGHLPTPERLPPAVRNFGRLPGSGVLLLGDAGVWLMAEESGRNHYLATQGETTLTELEKHPTFYRAPTHSRLPDILQHSIQQLKNSATPPPLQNLMETLLCGCMAQRIPEPLIWDTRKKRFQNH